MPVRSLKQAGHQRLMVAVKHVSLKISRLPEFIPDERRSGELGFDFGGTVGAVAACRDGVLSCRLYCFAKP